MKAAKAPTLTFRSNICPYGVFSTDTLEPRCGVAIGGYGARYGRRLEAEDLDLACIFDPVFDVPYWN